MKSLTQAYKLTLLQLLIATATSQNTTTAVNSTSVVDFNVAAIGSSTLISTSPFNYTDSLGNQVTLDTGCTDQHQTGTSKLQTITVYGDGTWIYAFQFDGFTNFAPTTQCDLSVSKKITLEDRDRIYLVQVVYQQNETIGALYLQQVRFYSATGVVYTVGVNASVAGFSYGTNNYTVNSELFKICASVVPPTAANISCQMTYLQVFEENNCATTTIVAPDISAIQGAVMYIYTQYYFSTNYVYPSQSTRSNCGRYVYSHSINTTAVPSNDPCTTYSDVNGQFNYYCYDRSNSNYVGNYTYALTITLNPTLSNATASTSVSYTLLDGCEYLEFDVSQFNLTGNLSLMTNVQNCLYYSWWPLIFNGSISVALNYCPYTYTVALISSPIGSLLLPSVSGGTVVQGSVCLNLTDFADPLADGNYTVNLTAQLNSYPNVTISQLVNFTVGNLIMSGVVFGVDASQILKSQYQQVDIRMQSLPYLFTFHYDVKILPSFGYYGFITFSTASSDNPLAAATDFSTVSPEQYCCFQSTATIYPTDSLGTYNVTATTIALNNSQSFTPNFWYQLIVFDGCNSTQMIPSVIANQIAIITSPAYNKQFLVVTNNASVSKNNNTYCGQTLYSLAVSPNAVGNTIGWSFNSTNLKATITPSVLGVYQITYTAWLQSYTNVTTSTTFNLTINPDCTLTKIVAQTLSDVTINIGDGPLQFNFFSSYTDSASNSISSPNFCGNFLLSAKVSDANSLTSSTLNAGVRLTTFSLDSTAFFFTAQPTLLTAVGVYTATLNVTMTSYPTIVLLQTFRITVTSTCTTSTLSTGQNFSPIQLYVGATAITVPFSAYTNSIATQYQNSNYCLSTIYVKSISTSQNGTSICSFDTTQATTSFTLQSCYLKEVGAYTITLIAKLQTFPQVTLSETINVIVLDPCLTTNIVPSNLTDLTILQQSSSQTGTFNPFTNTAAINVSNSSFCGGYQISASNYGVNGTSTTNSLCIFSVNQSSNTYQVDGCYGDALGQYTAIMVITMVNYPSIQLSQSFLITLLDLCNCTVLYSGQIIQNNQILVGALSMTQTFTPFQNTIAVQQNNSSYCLGNSYVYQISTNENNINLCSFGTQIAVEKLTFQACTRAEVGTYTVSVYGYLTNYSWIVTPLVQFYLTVLDNCAVTSIISQTIGDITFSTYDQEQFYSQFTNFNDSVSLQKGTAGYCGSLNYQVSITPNSLTLFNVNTTQLAFSAYSDSLSQVGTYTATLTISLVDFPNITISETFSIKVKDPCILATLSFSNQLLTMETSVLATNLDGTPNIVTQLIPAVQDSVSVGMGNPSLNICGQVTLSIASKRTLSNQTALSASELYLDSTISFISLYTQENTKMGIHNVTVVATLANYNLSSSAQLLAIVNGCNLQNLTYQLAPKYYLLTTKKQIWSIDISSVVQFPACGYTLQFANVTPSTSFLGVSSTSTSITYSLFSNSLASVNFYLITLTPQPLNYPYALVQGQQQFELQIASTGLCLITIFDAIQIEQLVSFGGYSMNTSSSYNFTTSVETAVGVSNYCGERAANFSINGTKYDNISFTNGSPIMFSPDFSVNGTTQNVSVTISLKLYPTVNFTTTFLATTLAWNKQSISNLTYFIGNKDSRVPYKDFQVTPKGHVYQSQANLFLVKDFKLLMSSPFDQSVLLTLPSWITIDLSGSQKTIVVFSDDQTNVGTYLLALVQFESWFKNAFTFTTFALIVKPTPLYTLPFLATIPTPQIVVSCPPAYNQGYTYVFAQAMDINSGGQVIQQNVTSSSNILQYDLSKNAIVVVGNLTGSISAMIQVSIENNFKLVQKYSFNILFSCPPVADSSRYGALNSFAGLTLGTNGTNDTSLFDPNYHPVMVQSISNTGLITIGFGSRVKVPQFTNVYIKGNRLLATNNSTQNASHLSNIINNLTLRISLVQKKTAFVINWTCTSFTSSQLLIQLNLSDPVIVSANQQDNIIVEFLQPGLFQLQSGQSIFQNISQLKVDFPIPPQQSNSAYSQKLRAATASAVTGTTITTLFFTVIIQIVAKKLIGMIWLFFLSVQMLILLNQKANIILPDCVITFMQQVAGIVNLEAIDKKKLMSFFKVPSTLTRPGSILDNLGLIGIAALFLAIFLILILVAAKFLKHPKVQSLLQRVKNVIFWSALIKYNQSAFLNFFYAGFVTVQFSPSIFQKCISGGILVIEGLIIVYQTYYLYSSESSVLNSQETRGKIGGLYSDLSTRSRVKVLYGQCFFVKRALVAAVLAFQCTYGVQFGMIYLALLINTLYLLHIRPYNFIDESYTDCLNEISLLLFQIMQAGLSPLNPDPKTRYDYGLVYIGGICILLLVNINFVIYKVSAQLILRVKVRFTLYKEKQKLSKIILRRFAQKQVLQELRIKAFQQKQQDMIEEAHRNKRISDLEYQRLRLAQSQMWNTRLFKPKLKVVAETKIVEAQPQVQQLDSIRELTSIEENEYESDFQQEMIEIKHDVETAIERLQAFQPQKTIPQQKGTWNFPIYGSEDQITEDWYSGPRPSATIIAPLSSNLANPEQLHSFRPNAGIQQNIQPAERPTLSQNSLPVFGPQKTSYGLKKSELL